MKRSLVDDIPERTVGPKIDIDFDGMRERLLTMYPLGFIPRQSIKIATGGILNPGSIANKDSKGEGIRGAIEIRRKICYPIDGVLEFLFGKNINAA